MMVIDGSIFTFGAGIFSASCFFGSLATLKLTRTTRHDAARNTRNMGEASINGAAGCCSSLAYFWARKNPRGSLVGFLLTPSANDGMTGRNRFVALLSRRLRFGLVGLQNQRFV